MTRPLYFEYVGGPVGLTIPPAGRPVKRVLKLGRELLDPIYRTLSKNLKATHTVSSKRMFGSCPHKYLYRYVYELEAQTPPEPLAKGIEFHENAEQIYSDSITNLTEEGQSYLDWAEEYEEFTPEFVEVPVAVPISKIYPRSISEIHQRPKTQKSLGYFAGVIDLVGTHTLTGKRFIVDHKRVKRFWSMPDLLATEQVGLYQRAWEILHPEYPITGGLCISRVKITSNNTHNYNNIAIKYLKALGININQKIIKSLCKALSKHEGHTSLPVNKNPIPFLPSGLLPLPLRDKARRVIVELDRGSERGSERGKALIRRIRVRSPESGYTVASLSYHQGKTIHVQRHYYTLSPEELDQIVRDFVGYVRQAHWSRKTNVWPRSPGPHCNWCPYRVPCELTRQQLAPASDWSEYGLVHAPAHIEVLGRLSQDLTNTLTRARMTANTAEGGVSLK